MYKIKKIKIDCVLGVLGRSKTAFILVQYYNIMELLWQVGTHSTGIQPVCSYVIGVIIFINFNIPWLRRQTKFLIKIFIEFSGIIFYFQGCNALHPYLVNCRCRCHKTFPQGVINASRIQSGGNVNCVLLTLKIAFTRYHYLCILYFASTSKARAPPPRRGP